jgi:hypothetical protein
MIRLFSQLLELPLNVLIGSMSEFVHSMQDIQELYRQEIELFLRREGTSLLTTETLDKSGTNVPPTALKEMDMEYGTCGSTSGKYGKTFRTYVQYTREDFFATLKDYFDEITRNISAEEWKGEQRARFIAEMEDPTKGIPIPSKWKSIPDGVEPNLAKTKIIGMSQENLDDYLTVLVEEVGMVPEVKPDYEKEQAKSLSRLVEKFGP